MPLTQAEFDRVQLLEGRRRSAVWGGVLCVAFGLALARFPVLLPLGLVIGGVSFGLWIVCELALRRALPRVEPGPGAGEITLHRVHRQFIAAVESRRDRSVRGR